MTPEAIAQLTQALGLTALAVGTLIIGKRYYEERQFINWINAANNEIKRRADNCFTIDRLIDADCIDGKTLSIGVNGNDKPENILSKQGIRLGQDGDIKRLVSFFKADNALVYNFEDNTKLTMTKNNATNKIMYSFETPGKTVVKEMDDKIVKLYKTISMSSSELDRIAELKTNELK